MESIAVKSLSLPRSAGDLRRFASIPVGGSRNEGATLKRSVSHLDKQMILKLTGYTNGRANAAVCGMLRYRFCATAM
jgi:hypothetical protein